MKDNPSVKIERNLYEKVAKLHKEKGQEIKWHIDRALRNYLRLKKAI